MNAKFTNEPNYYVDRAYSSTRVKLKLQQSLPPGLVTRPAHCLSRGYAPFKCYRQHQPICRYHTCWAMNLPKMPRADLAEHCANKLNMQLLDGKLQHLHGNAHLACQHIESSMASTTSSFTCCYLQRSVPRNKLYRLTTSWGSGAWHVPGVRHTPAALAITWISPRGQVCPTPFPLGSHLPKQTAT